VGVFYLIDKVRNIIRENNMFNHGDKVVVAVSGGPDSICLLHLLYTLKEELGISLVAAHVNHCLRGEEADKDEAYVRDFCKNINIKCYVKRVDVNKISKDKGMSSETAGREVRYNFFKEVLHNINGNKIALAHNANDQAETILMRIFRGTGLDGLIGIKAVRDDIYVRPIIDIQRKEIEDYCEKHDLRPRIDKTNLENIYTRNKIRLEMIPYIQKNFNPDIIESLNRLSHTIKIDSDYINGVALEKYKKFCRKEKEAIIIEEKVFREHEAVMTRVIRMALKEIVGDLYNFEKGHIYDIIDIQRGTTGKSIMLPNGVIALNDYGRVYMCIGKDKKEEKKELEYKLVLNSQNNLKDIGLRVSLNIINNKNEMNPKEDNLVKYFDYDKIVGDISLRFRRNGDRFTPLGMKGSKKLKDLFIDLKISKEKRDNIPLIIFGDEIGWVVGYRISDKFKVENHSKTILKIKIEREEKVNDK